MSSKPRASLIKIYRDNGRAVYFRVQKQRRVAKRRHRRMVERQHRTGKVRR